MIGGIHGPRGICDREVEAATKKCWREWMGILDAWETDDKSFRPIFKYLMKCCGLNYYWAQVIAAEYIMKRSYTGDLNHLVS